MFDIYVFSGYFFRKMTTIESASVKKIISDLSAEGFLFHEDFDEIDEYRFGKLYRRRRLDNVVFEKEGVIIKIYKDLFFRVTGLSHLFDEVSQKPVRVSDDEFYEMLKHIIRYKYEQQIKDLKHPEQEIQKHISIKT